MKNKYPIIHEPANNDNEMFHYDNSKFSNYLYSQKILIVKIF